MTPEVFTRWLQLQGHKVIEYKHHYWYYQGPRILQAFPYHRLISPDDEEVEQLLTNSKAIGLRYSAPFDHPSGFASYHVVYQGRDYPLSSLPKNARYDVRKGMQNFAIGPDSFEKMASEGWELRRETLARQGRASAEKRNGWEQLCSSAAKLPGFETWSALRGDELAASLIAFRCDDCYSILYQQSRTKYLSLGVNNALTYTFTNEVIRKPGIQYIFYGLHSLDAPPSVDEFKFRMGFIPKPVRQRVVFHPRLAPLVNPRTHAVLKKLVHSPFNRPALAKAEGMFRFYLEGLKPLPEQEWPVPLIDQKAESINNC